MKKTIFSILSFLMLIVSCTQEMEPLNKESEVMEFHAYLTDNPQSKTIRQEDGKVFWSPHEDIHIFQGSRSGKFTSQNEEISATATFTGTMNNDVDNGTDYWAVYPWDNDNLFWGGVVGVPIQSYQRTQSGSFVDEVYPSVAKSSTNHLQFYNICGGIKFRVFNPGIKQVVFRGNNDEVVAGLALIAFSEGKPVLYGMGNTMSHPSSKNIFVSAPDESGFIPGKYYYIVIPPIVFDNGFSLVFCNSENQEATFSTDKKITVSRSKFGVLNDLDEGLVFTEGEEAQRVLEKSALIAIYNSLNGNNWLDKTNWLSNSPVGTWSGVTTDENGFVSELRLNDINLQGVFPVEICQLSYLQSLLLNGSVSGSIPNDIGNLKSLRQFSIYSQSLTGSIPESICEITGLEELIISGSEIGGTLPDDIGNLVHLRNLQLSPFNGEGPLPESFSALLNLEYLTITSAHLNQAFPEAIVNMSKLEYLNLVSCGLTGSIPEEIGNLSSLRLLGLSGNNLSGDIPSSIGSLDNLVSLILSGNAFTGFPDNLSQCDLLRDVYISDNRDVMTFNNDIWKAPSLTWIDLNNSHISGSLSADIGEAINLTSINLSCNNFSGPLPPEMSELQALSTLDLHNNAFTGSIPSSFSALTQLEFMYAYNNYMSGAIAEDVVTMEVFARWQITPQYNDGEFTYELYESTDYSADKTVSLIHPATKGNGINIVLMGDAFTDRDIADGSYEYAMNLACESLFLVEPFTSFEEYFNVYVITLVSKNGHYVGETSLGIDYSPILGPMGYSGGYGSKARNYVNELIPGLDNNQLCIGIVMNNNPNGSGVCTWGADPPVPYGSGFSVSIIPNSYEKGTAGLFDFKYTVIHELGGHGFGILADEYITYDGNISEGNTTYVESVQEEYGWFKNISCSSDPSLVPWSAFLSIPEYVNDGLGIYEGGYGCKYGVWRPTEASIMSCQYATAPYFNAPSREAIYRRIHLIAEGPEWVYNFEEFLEWDAKNLLSH